MCFYIPYKHPPDARIVWQETGFVRPLMRVYILDKCVHFIILTAVPSDRDLVQIPAQPLDFRFQLFYMLNHDRLSTVRRSYFFTIGSS